MRHDLCTNQIYPDSMEWNHGLSPKIPLANIKENQSVHFLLAEIESSHKSNVSLEPIDFFFSQGRTPVPWKASSTVNYE